LKEYRAELLVAIAIITILSGLLLSAVLAAKRKTAPLYPDLMVAASVSRDVRGQSAVTV